MRLLCEFADLHDNWWPWTKEAVLSGCMERTHMTYLLDVLQATSRERVLTLQVGVGGILWWLPPCSEHPTVHTLQFGYGMFQDDPSHIKMVDAAIQVFSSSPAPSHLIFVMGVVNHWVSLLAYRPETSQQRRSLAELTLERECVGEFPSQQVLLTQQYLLNQINASEGCGKEEGILPGRLPSRGCVDSGVHLVLFDSQNKPTMVMTDEDIASKIAEWEEKDLRRKGRPYSEWERQNYQQALRDQRELLPVLAQCLSGSSTLVTEYIDSRITALVGHYRESVHEPLAMSGEGMDRYLALLSHWLETYNQPQHIRKRVLQLLEEMGAGHLGRRGHQELNFFVSDMLSHLGECDGGEGAEMLEVAMEIKELLSTIDCS